MLSNILVALVKELKWSLDKSTEVAEFPENIKEASVTLLTSRLGDAHPYQI